MSQIAIKRRLAEATRALVKASDPDVAHVAELLDSISELLTDMTGEPVRVRITSVGHKPAPQLVAIGAPR